MEPWRRGWKSPARGAWPAFVLIGVTPGNGLGLIQIQLDLDLFGYGRPTILDVRTGFVGYRKYRIIQILLDCGWMKR